LFAFDLEHGDVGLLVEADDLGGYSRRSVMRTVTSSGIGDDVRVREDVAVGVTMKPEPSPGAAAFRKRSSATCWPGFGMPKR
jgi:hypothetical protein